MLSFPQTTVYNRTIPKRKFYEKLEINSALKQAFTNQIKKILWRNKLATSTLNLAQGQNVDEIEVFEIKLTSQNLDENVLRQMDKEIPYHILFLLEWKEKYSAVICYKEKCDAGKNNFKLERYYNTDWMTLEELPIAIQGLTMDAVYENFIRQIAGNQLQGGSNETLKESVDRQKEREALQKQITRLEIRIHRERQLNRRMEINAELKKLRKKLEVL
ncbi:MAG: DUF4391 domain-containing protein [Candidatus Sumerlaeales bacterium]|nr:DUF4391 domain-containing protein [Candidatus Sumerlaeales bacterium]